MTKFKHLFFIILLSILFVMSSLPVQAATRVQDFGEKLVIVIDPGHGGENLGTIESGFLEKEMTLTTAQAMYDELSLFDDVEIYLTRTEDVDLSLKERAEYAASVNADFLFSIHYNASVEHNLFGSEVWISATAPYNPYGYQFGYEFLQQMQDMGLHLRGIKTRLKDDKTSDYYGIIRESVALDIPAAILEHCHVDEERDNVFCDSDHDLMAFGEADAHAVARYFGLKSSFLEVDYSGEENLPNVSKDTPVKATLLDETPPDICMIELIDTEYKKDTVNVTLRVSAADYDSPLIFYDYSSDGGHTYSSLQSWPGSNALTGEYKDTFELTVSLSAKNLTGVKFRAYNLFDASTESNILNIPISVSNVSEEDMPQTTDRSTTEDKVPVKEEKKTPGTTTFMPAISDNVGGEDDTVSFISFLKLCLVIVIIVFFFVIISQSLSYQKRKRRRRQRRNESGNNRNQLR